MTRSTRRGEGETGSIEAQTSNADLGRWVVWGTGEPPDIDGARPASDVAMEIAYEKDREWWDRPDRWAVTVDGEESDADDLVTNTPEARGFAPYLAAGREEDLTSPPMRGTLRSDVAPRRKAEPR